MGSLATELRPIAAGLAASPRVYADANLPAGAVSFMRQADRYPPASGTGVVVCFAPDETGLTAVLAP